MVDVDAKEGTVADESVTDDALSAAWDAVKDGSSDAEVAKEEPKKEEPKEETVKEEAPKEEAKAETPPAEEQQASEPMEAEKLSQQESSRLGRKVHGIGERIKQIESQLASLNEQKTKNPVEMPEIVTTPEDIDKVLYIRQQRAQEEQLEYQKSYLQTIAGLAEQNKGMHDEIFDEMIKHHNERYSPNGFADARVNYAEAKAAVVLRKLNSPQLPKREIASKAPVTPAASATRTAAKPVATVNFDDPYVKSYAEYLKRQGWTDEDIAKAAK